MFRHGLATLSAVLFTLAATDAHAQDVTLKGVSSFPEGTLSVEECAQAIANALK